MTAVTTQRRSGGLIAAIASYVALTLAYAFANQSTPQPSATDAEVLQYVQSEGTMITLGVLLMIASAVALTGLALALHRTPGARRTVALTGGLLAAAALVGSAVSLWIESGSTTATEAAAWADWSFLFGGPAFAVASALLILGISLDGRTPRALSWTGLLLAVAGGLSVLSLVITTFGYLLPLVRFGGLIWLVFATVRLARRRTDQNITA